MIMLLASVGKALNKASFVMLRLCWLEELLLNGPVVGTDAQRVLSEAAR